MTLFARWQDAPADPKSWPHFTAKELACRCQTHCDGEYFHDPAFLDGLEAIRAIIGAPLTINSARRCPLHNAHVGGAPLSMHRQTLAVDIAIANHDRRTLARAALSAGFMGFGYGRTFLHIDRRSRQTSWFYPGSRPFWKQALEQGGLPCPRS